MTLPQDEPVIQFSFGLDYMLMLTQSKQVYGLGNNSNGQIASDRNTCNRPQFISRIHADHVTAGSTFSGAIGVDGSLLLWGVGPFGRIVEPQRFNEPREVQTLNISKFAPSRAFAIAISDDGKAYAFGANHRGQLGLGDKVEREGPSQLTSLKRKRVS